MCGRFTLRTPVKEIADAFDVPLASGPDNERTLFELEALAAPRFNIAPTQPVMAVRHDATRGRRELCSLRWGLVPHWADDVAIGSSMINARSESATTRPAFREALRLRRCLIPADGFYEWKRGGGKQPFYIRTTSGGLFAFAGLWERWQRADQVVESCTILTTAANDVLRPLHERMPVILPRENYAAWLDPQLQAPSEIETLMATAPAFAAHPVSTRVNSPAHDDPRCVEPAAPEKVQQTLFE